MRNTFKGELVDLTTWQAGGEYFRYCDQNIFYRCEGQGPVILLIHGFPTASWDWYKLMPTLSQHYQCVCLDLLGFGFSDKPSKPYRIKEQAQICLALLEHLNINECHLVSHDYGDTVAQELIALYEQGLPKVEFKSLVTLNGGLFPETHHPVLVQKLLLSPLGFLLTPFLGEHTLAKNLTKIFGKNTPPSAGELQNFWQLMARANGHKIMHKIIYYMTERKINRARWVGALQQTTVPLRHVNGADDPISGRHLAKRYQELIPNPDVVLLDDVGHYPQVESPEKVSNAILQFIAQY